MGAILFHILAWVGTALLASPSKPSLKTIKFGLAFNFSDVSVNSYNPFGNSVRNGALMGLEQINTHLFSRNLQALPQEFNYGSDILNARKVAEEAYRSDVLAVVGYEFSEDALIAAPLHQKNQLLMITPSASADRLTSFGCNVRQSTFVNSYQGQVIAQLAWKALRGRRVLSVVAADCAYCEDLAKGFERKFSALGGKVAKTISILADELELESKLALAREVDFDVVFVPNHELTSARVISTLVRLGIQKPFLGGDGWRTLGKDFFQKPGHESVEAYMTAHWHPTLSTHKSKEFVSTYKKRFGHIPTDSAVLAFDTVTLLGKAIENIPKGNAVDRAALSKAIQSIRSFDGVSGRFFFPFASTAPLKTAILLKSSPQGFVINHVLEPEE